ncbi:hypothetical protein NL676_013740 [Syzygium grande]|nr:hypothetical protein NL676_013740 [Syzygium grande]
MSMASFCMSSFMSALLLMVLRSAAAKEADEGFWSSEQGFVVGAQAISSWTRQRHLFFRSYSHGPSWVVIGWRE